VQHPAPLSAQITFHSTPPCLSRQSRVDAGLRLKNWLVGEQARKTKKPLLKAVFQIFYELYDFFY